MVQKTFEKCFAHEQADVSVQGLKVPLSEQWMRLAERRWVSEDLKTFAINRKGGLSQNCHKTVKLVPVRKSSFCYPTLCLIQAPQKLLGSLEISMSNIHPSFYEVLYLLPWFFFFFLCETLQGQTAPMCIVTRTETLGTWHTSSFDILIRFWSRTSL